MTDKMRQDLQVGDMSIEDRRLGESGVEHVDVDMPDRRAALVHPVDRPGNGDEVIFPNFGLLINAAMQVGLPPADEKLPADEVVDAEDEVKFEVADSEAKGVGAGARYAMPAAAVGVASGGGPVRSAVPGVGRPPAGPVPGTMYGDGAAGAKVEDKSCFTEVKECCADICSCCASTARTERRIERGGLFGNQNRQVVRERKVTVLEDVMSCCQGLCSCIGKMAGR